MTFLTDNKELTAEQMNEKQLKDWINSYTLKLSYAPRTYYGSRQALAAKSALYILTQELKRRNNA